jgi:EmrB/QacA subfamily drug resistance transporter
MTQSLSRLAAVLVPGGLLALLNTTITGVAIPDLVADFGTDIATAQWVSTAYMLAAGIAIPLGGWASIRFGMRNTWLVAMTLFALGSLASAIAPDVTSLSLARVLQGAGGGALEPLMLTVLAQAAGPQRMGRVLGAASAVMSIGPLAGPALGGIAVDTLGWRWIYVLSAAFGVLIFARSWFVLERSRPQASQLDLVGLTLVTTATALGLFGLTHAASPAGFDALAITMLVISVIALALFAVWGTKRGEHAIVDLSAFKAQGFGPAVFIMTMMGAAVFPLFFGLPQFYQGVAGLNALTAGLLMIPYGLGNLVVMPLAGWLSDRFDARRIVWAGASLTLLAFALLLTTGPTTPLTLFAGLSLAIGIGLGAIASPTVSSMYRALPPSLVNAGSTILFVVLQLGGALGVAVLVLLMGGTAWTAAIGTLPFAAPIFAATAIALAGTWLARVKTA